MRKLYMTREWFTPKGATKITDKLSDAVAYVDTNDMGKPRAVVFFGKQSKPAVNFWYRDTARRDQAVQQAFEGRRRTMARKSEERQARKAFVHTVKVGDLFHTSWGYDQTNVEFFQVVDVKGKYAVLREIGGESVQTGHDAGRCSAKRGAFLTPRYDGDDRGLPIRRLIQDGSIKIDDVRRAYPTKEGETHYWSSGH